MQLRQPRLGSVLVFTFLFLSAATLAKVSSAVRPWLDAYKIVKRVDTEWQTFDGLFTYAIDVANGAKKPTVPKSRIKSIDVLHARIVAASESINKLLLPQPPVRPDIRVIGDDPRAASQAWTTMVVWVEQQHASQTDRQQVEMLLKQLNERAAVTAAAGRQLEQLLGHLMPADPITKQLQAAWVDMIWKINPKVGDLRLAIEAKQRALVTLSKREDEFVSNSGHTLHGFLKTEAVLLAQSLKQASKELEVAREEWLSIRDELRATQREAADERRAMNADVRDLRRDEGETRRDLKSAQRSIRNYDAEIADARRLRDSVDGYRCIEKNNWQDCNNHPQEKAEWRRKMRQKSDEKIAEIEDEYRWARKNVRSLSEEAATLAEDLKAEQGPYLERIAAAQSKVKDFRARQNELKANLPAFVKKEAMFRSLLETNAANMDRMAKLGYR